MNSLLLKALTSLSNTCNKSALSPVDEDRIKMILKVIYKNGIPINPAEIEQWLEANKWQQKPVKSIVSWAQTISSGKRVPLNNQNQKVTEKEIWAKLNSR